MTGSGDKWRCVHRSDCEVDYFLRLSRHLAFKEDRSVAVVSEQWNVAVMTLATWTVTTHKRRVEFHGGEAHVPCEVCKTLLPMSTGDSMTTGILHCHRTARCRQQALPIYLLHSIAKSPFSDALNAARTACGGVRGYPLLRGLNSRLQLPVLHCTGTNAKAIVYFTLACLPEAVQTQARQTLLAITGKGTMDAIYLREFRELVAHAAAQPEIFSADLDVTFIVLLQLCQLVNASWRASLTDVDACSRAGAAAITRLAASIMGPLYEAVKPLDPETKDTKVKTLYLHAPIAHLHHQVASNRDDVAFVSDDNMEGHLRGVGRFMYNHGNNASQAALLSDLAGLCDATVKFATPRSHPSSLVFTKYVRVCACWKTLGVCGSDDFAALATVGEETPELAVERLRGGDELRFTLPLHDVVDANKARREDSSGNPLTGKKESLRRGLRRRQGVITACFCGRLTGKPGSVLMEVARRRHAAERVRAAAVAAAAAASAGPAAAVASAAPTGAEEPPDEEMEESASEAEDGASLCGSADEMLGVEGPVTVLAAEPALAKPKKFPMSQIIKGAIPPPWLLRRCFPMPAAYAAALSSAGSGGGPGAIDIGAAEPSPEELDAAVRKYTTIMECFVMRTKTAEFARWSVRAKVDPLYMIEAANTVRERLLSLRLAQSPVLGAGMSVDI